MLYFIIIIIIIFPSFRAPVRVGLSLPWCPVGTIYMSQNKLDWIGLGRPSWVSVIETGTRIPIPGTSHVYTWSKRVQIVYTTLNE